MSVRVRLAAGCAMFLAALSSTSHAQGFDPAARTGPSLPTLTVSSPSATVTVWIGVDQTNRLFYAAAEESTLVLGASPLGITVDGVDLGTGVIEVIASQPRAVDDAYAMHGNHRQARDRFNEVVLAAHRTPPGDPVFLVVIRAYDDGVAYRYVVPGSGRRTIGGEASAWRLPSGSVVWAQSSTTNYESNYWTARIGTLDADIGGPMTAALPAGGFAVITEGALRHYSGMSYHVDVGSDLVRSQFRKDASWSVAGASSTPWRLVIVSRTLDGLVNSDLVASVNDPPDPALFPQGADSWFIRPGRALWSWWSDPSSPGNGDVQRAYVDAARALRAEYVLLDAGWEQGFATPPTNQFARLADLVNYARDGAPVGIWIWKDFGSLSDAAARREFFGRVSAAGAVGVKIENFAGIDAESFSAI